MKRKSVECLGACIGSIRLKLHVAMHTHTNGNMLALDISRGDDNIVGAVTANGMISQRYHKDSHGHFGV